MLQPACKAGDRGNPTVSEKRGASIGASGAALAERGMKRWYLAAVRHPFACFGIKPCPADCCINLKRSPGTKNPDDFSDLGSKFEPGVLSCVTGQRMYFVYKLEHTVPATVPGYY